MTEENQVIETTTTNAISLNAQAKSFLYETAKWSHFLAILGYVLTGLMVVLALFLGSFMALLPGNAMAGGEMPAGVNIFMSFIYIVVAVVYLIPTTYLFRFAKGAKSAIKNGDETQLAKALENQKSVYKFMGIFMIITIGFYVLAALVGFLTAMMV